MSTLSNTRLPKPKDWQDFERKARHLFEHVLADPDIHMHGRNGQSQHGIDFWGLRNQDSNRVVGVQCKLSNDDITADELTRELDKTKDFFLPISEFYLVTTAARDAKIQQITYEKTQSSRAADRPMRIEVWGWEDVEDAAAKYAEAWQIFDPTFNPFAERARAEAQEGFKEVTEQLRALREAWENTQRDQNLGLPLSPPFGGGRPRLIFYGYDVNFSGRDTELAELRAFASARASGTADFAWWLWSGSGGQGKTRLAVRLCGELMEKGWQCGFLAQSAEYRAWNTWTVTRPTLIVIDHLASRAKEIRNAIASLSRAAHRFNAPLRILMLERPFDPDDEWVNQFIPSASPLEAAEILTFAYRPDGTACRSLADCTRCLGPLAEPDLIAIVESILATEQNDRPPVADPGAIIAWLRDADAELRPLFLILAMRALCNGSAQDLRQWDRQQLVEAILRRDFLLWQDALGIRHAARLGPERKLFEDHLTLIVAATITSRTDERLTEQLKQFGIETPARIQQDWVRVITGDPLAGNRREFALLKPDVVGECFVLERCARFAGS